MKCSVVTVARTLGAMGEDVAREVAQQLDFQYVDDEIITRAAERAGVSPESVSESEHSQSLLSRVLASMAVAPMEPDAFTSPELLILPDYSSHAYRDLIGRVIRERAEQGRAVIVAHGAAVPLASMPGVLRVFITASPPVRAKRLVENGVPERDAAKAVENSDKERANFFRRFYSVREELPTQYDVVLNTDILSINSAAKMVVAATAG